MTKKLKLDFKLNKTIYNYINNEGTFFHKLQSAMFGFKLLSVLLVLVCIVEDFSFPRSGRHLAVPEDCRTNSYD